MCFCRNTIPCLILVLFLFENTFEEKLFVRLSKVLVRGTSSNTLTILNTAKSEDCIEALATLYSFTTVQYTTNLTIKEAHGLQTLSSRVNIWCDYKIGQENAVLKANNITNDTHLQLDDFVPEGSYGNVIKTYSTVNETMQNGNINALVASMSRNLGIVRTKPENKIKFNELGSTKQIILNDAAKLKDYIAPGDTSRWFDQTIFRGGLFNQTEKITSDLNGANSKQFDQTKYEPRPSNQTFRETGQVSDMDQTHFGQFDQTVFKSKPSNQILHENNQDWHSGQIDQKVYKIELSNQPFHEIDQINTNLDDTHSKHLDQTEFDSKSFDQLFQESNPVSSDFGDTDIKVVSLEVCESHNRIDCNIETESGSFDCCNINDSIVPDSFGNFASEQSLPDDFSRNQVSRLADSSSDLTTRNETQSGQSTDQNENFTDQKLADASSNNRSVSNTTSKANNEIKAYSNSNYTDPRLTDLSSNSSTEIKNKTQPVQSTNQQNFTNPKLTDASGSNGTVRNTFKTKEETKSAADPKSNDSNPRQFDASKTNETNSVSTEANPKSTDNQRQFDASKTNETKSVSTGASPKSTDNPRQFDPSKTNETKPVPSKTNPNSNYTNPRLASPANTSKSNSHSEDERDTSEFDSQFVEKNAMGLNPRFYYILLVDIAGDQLENHLRMLWKKYKTYKFIVVPRSTPDLVYYFSPYPECGVGGRLKAVKAGEIAALPLVIERLVWNLHKCKMGVVIYSRVPTAIPVDENNQLNESTGAKFIGQDGMFMNTLIQRMNFTPVLFTPRNVRMEYGIKRVKGKLTGTFLPILNGSAEICINGHFVKDYRDRRVDFVKPITLDYVSILAPKASVIPPVITVLLSFEPSVWIMIATTFFTTALVYIVYLKYAVPKRTTHFFWSARGKSVECCSGVGVDVPLVFFDMFRSFISSPPSKCLLINSNFERILMASVLTFSIVITSSFQGNLVRFLSAPLHYPDIETLKQLEESPLLIQTSSLSWRDIFYSDPILWGLASKVHRWKSEQDMHNSDGNFAGFQRINVHSYKYFKDIILTGLKNNATRTLHTLSQNLITYYLAYIVIKDSPYRTRIDSLISQMDQAGLVTKWSSDVIKYTLETYRTVEERRTKEKKVFTVEDLSAAFIVLTTGVVLSSLTLLVEVLVQYWHGYRFRKVIIPSADSVENDMFQLKSRDFGNRAPAKTHIEFCL